MNDASILFIAKNVERRGDGKADMAIWRLLLPDFYVNRHVRFPVVIMHHQDNTCRDVMTKFHQVKYSIEALRRICIAEGAMGLKLAKDVKFNSFVNTKGSPLLLNKPT